MLTLTVRGQLADLKSLLTFSFVVYPKGGENANELIFPLKFSLGGQVKMKKLLAILCTVALLLTSLFTGMAVMAEEPELKPLAPSSYGGDGQSFAAEAWAGGANTQISAFVNAKFEAMVIPSADSHMFQWGFWTGLRLSISGNTARFWMFDTGAQSEVATLDKNYNGTPYKLTVTSQLLNEGVLPAEGEEYTTAHEHFVYNLYIDDKSVIKDFVVLGNDPIVPGNKVNKCLRASNCTIYDIDTFEAAFTATDADAAGPLDGLTALTPADFGIAYGRSAGDYVQGTTQKDTANSVFETNIMFENGGEMVYPRSTGWPGIKLAASGTKNLAISDFSFGSGWETTVIEPAAVNVGSLVGNMLNLKIAFEVGDFDDNNIVNEDETVTVLEDDVRLTYYINGIEVYQNTSYADYDYDENDNPIPGTQKAKTGTLLFTQEDRTLYSLYFDKDVIIEDPNCEVPVMTENVATNGGLVVGALNTVDVTLAEGDSIAMGYLGNLAVTEGALVYTDKAGNASTVAENMAGVKFNLKTLAERIDLNGDGFVTEVKARVWINNKATSAYQYLNAIPADQTIALSGTAALSAASQVPTGLMEYSLSSFSTADVVINDAKGWAYTINNTELDASPINTLFSAKINISKNGTVAGVSRSIITLGYSGASFNFQYGASDTRGLIIRPDKTQNDWLPVFPVGKECLWQISIQRSNLDLNGDGEINDARIGYFIDGSLFTGKFYTVTLDSISEKVAIAGERSFSGDSTMSFTIRDVQPTDDTVYEEIGIEDFGLENGTYVADGTGRHWFNKASAVGSIHNKAVKTKIKFVRAEGATGAIRSELTYGGASNLTDAIYISMEANGVGAIRLNQWGTKYTLPDLTQNVEHELVITSKMIDGHLQFGFYVDGKFQRHFYQKNSGDNANRDYIGIHSWGSGYADGELILGGSDYSIAATAEETYTVAASNDTVTYTINGESVTEATVLSEVGEYVIGTSAKHLYGTVALDQTGTKTVVIYKENDLNADNTVNILDFIAAQKSASEEDFDLGKVGAFAAGIAVGERCTAKEIVALKIAILFAL